MNLNTTRWMALLCWPAALMAATYEIGPGKTYATIGAAPWSSLQPGDTVNIHPRTPITMTTAAAVSGVTITLDADASAVPVGSSVYFANGPGTLASVTAVDGNIVTVDTALTIGAGTAVRFFPPYFEKIILTQKGTPELPLLIQGIPDADTGALPIVDATDATTSPNMQHYNEPAMDDLGLIVAGPTSTRNDYPKWVTIRSLRLQHARGGVTYTDINGAQRMMGRGAAAVRLWQADHIILDGLEIYENDNGIFAKTSGTAVWNQFVSNLTLRRSHFWSNGYGTQCHQSYLEVNGVTYEFNFYDLPKAGTAVAQIKDRSAGMVVRYNYILQAGRYLDLVEAQDGQSVLLPLASYRESFVYGNVFYMTAPPPSAANLIHYGFDGVPTADRAGYLYVYHNTFVIERDYKEAYRIVMVYLNSMDDKVDFRNNIVVNKPLGSQYNALLGWAYTWGSFTFGVNWVSPHWATCRDGVPCNATVSGTENFYTPPAVTDQPGFRNLAGRDFTLGAAASAIGRAGPLPTAVTSNSLGLDLTPRYQYVAPMSYIPRTSVRDLGAYESGGAMVILTPSLANAMAKAAYTQTLQAAGGTAPYTWSVTGGNLCAGLTLSTTGVISGVPAAPARCSFTAAVTDATGSTATMALSIRVSPAPQTIERRVGRRGVVIR